VFGLSWHRQHDGHKPSKQSAELLHLFGNGKTPMTTVDEQLNIRLSAALHYTKSALLFEAQTPELNLSEEDKAGLREAEVQLENVLDRLSDAQG